MKNFIKEFKEFINRGNVLDMAIGVIIGAAFKDIVTSLVDNIISPIIGLFGGKNFDQYQLVIGEATLKYGAFITTVINFLIMAFVIFMMVKIMNGISKKFEKKEEEAAPAAPTTKTCPYCMSEIKIEATRCPHCTSVLED